ncbi:hypothetical protein [Paraliomyxa miuraensis]|uniref:hypothetical protein n=1 Tax=Paraliomyxa miuraensis TaxID=376150 RepID=UPI002252CB2E|nr:hypothetical protein [Paraliomyxa miuraensis]MCX4242879.1 hypothetical protein [Paraliomyxa miuraensis]
MAEEGLVAAPSRQEAAPRDRFRVRVALCPDALWDRVLAHPKVRVAHEPAPDPAPPEGAPFLAARQSPTELRLRHWAGPADATSPVIILELRPDGHGGTLVDGRFETRHRQRLLVDFPRVRHGGAVWIGAGIVATLLSLALLTPVLVGSPTRFVVSVVVLLFFFTIPTALVFIPGLLIWNAEGRKQLTPPLWELVGELMTPIALPEIDTDRPFRGHALPVARE